MSADLFISLVLFAIVTSVTPGPNNLMLLASGVNFGFRRSIPHMLGIGCGFMLMLFLMGLGLGQIFLAFPSAYTVLKLCGGGYMLWLAWKIANSGPVGDGKVRGTPMTFLGAAAFQWVNPKAWVMSITAVTTYAVSGRPLYSALVIALTFGLVNIPNVSLWALFGSALKSTLADPLRLRIFNWTMAAALVISLWPLLRE